MARAKPNPVEMRADMPSALWGSGGTGYNGFGTAAPDTLQGMSTLATFTDRAPTSTPYGDFVAPDPNATSKAMAFRAAEGQKAIERSAAARGTLLNGGTLKALEGFRQGLASTEYDNDFNRALSAYETNRATNQQNFGQSLASFGGNLDAFGANTNAALGWGRLGLDSTLAGYDRGYQASRDAISDDFATRAADDARNAYRQQVAQAQANAFAPPQAPRAVFQASKPTSKPRPWWAQGPDYAR